MLSKGTELPIASKNELYVWLRWVNDVFRFLPLENLFSHYASLYTIINNFLLIYQKKKNTTNKPWNSEQVLN